MEEYCSWWQCGEGLWESSCNKELIIIEGATPEECEMKFCCFCGKHISQTIKSEQEEAHDAQ